MNTSANKIGNSLIISPQGIYNRFPSEILQSNKVPQNLHIEILANGERENMEQPSASLARQSTNTAHAVANTPPNSKTCCTLTPGNQHTQHNLVAVVTKRVSAHINGSQFAATSKHVEKGVVN